MVLAWPVAFVPLEEGCQGHHGEVAVMTRLLLLDRLAKEMSWKHLPNFGYKRPISRMSHGPLHASRLVILLTDRFELGGSDVSQKCFLNFCD